jgi:predicted XRE-type DNA-binding protein
MSESIVNSSGNVFIDLGYSPDKAAIFQMRADLMADLRKWIKAKRLTQAKAAEVLGVSQSRVSDLIRGKWERFSLERRRRDMGSQNNQAEGLEPPLTSIVRSKYQVDKVR